MPITWLDIIVLAFMLISGLLAMARGFTREVLSILSWAAAGRRSAGIVPAFSESGARGDRSPLAGRHCSGCRYLRRRV
ncbi:MAG: CvpA family protein, partial [Fimbriimonadaceae bacterium]|nr:CvpA family protein [Alphaproteobacteria bacterium]